MEDTFYRRHSQYKTDFTNQNLLVYHNEKNGEFCDLIVAQLKVSSIQPYYVSKMRIMPYQNRH